MSDEFLGQLPDKDIVRVIVFCLRSAAKAERERIVADFMFRDFESADRHASEAAALEDRASYYERTYLYADCTDAI